MPLYDAGTAIMEGQIMPREAIPQPNNMFAELLAQISGANPNWAYDDAQVSQLDDAFKRQFAEQQGQQQSPYALPPIPPERPLDMPTPAPQIPPPQMPTSRLQDQEMTAAIMSQRGEMPAWMADMQRAEAQQRAPQQMPATAATAIGGSQVPGIPTATGGLDPARQAQGIPRIPTATPGMNRPAFDVPVQQMPRPQRMGKPMSPMFEGQPGMMTQRQPPRQLQQGMGQPLQPLGSRMPNTGQMISSYGGQQQRPTAMTPMQGQPSPRQPSQISNRRPALDQWHGGYGP